MSLNSEKLDDMEKKMGVLEQTLLELKKAIVERKQAIGDGHESDYFYEISETNRKKIDYIMKNFDFEKVHAIMKCLDWKWAFAKEGVPSVEELKSEARRLLVEACKEKTCVSTGGFRAVYEKDDRNYSGSNDDYVGLEFIIEELEGFEDGENHDSDLDYV